VSLIWFNQGYSSIRDAMVMIREEAGPALRLLISHKDLHAPAMHAADLTLLEPGPVHGEDGDERAYLDFCLETCAREGVALFVPQKGRAMLAAHVAAFAAIGTRLAVPADRVTLKLIDDKAEFFAAATAIGIPLPWTREVTSAQDFDAALDLLEARGQRVCVKPPHGVFGGGFWRLKPGRSLFATLMNPDAHEIAPDAMREALGQAPGQRLLVLEYLAGTEWSLDCVCQSGELVVGVARRKLGRVQRPETDGPIFAIARHAVAAFGLSGLINLQFKAAEPDDQDIRLLEINTRMSGGCLYTRHAGVKLPWIHVALELGLMARAAVPRPYGGALVSPSAEAYEVPDAGAWLD
jgi:hypothetical protein